jgi:hypothetical protein
MAPVSPVSLCAFADSFAGSAARPLIPDAGEHRVLLNRITIEDGITSFDSVIIGLRIFLDVASHSSSAWYNREPYATA